MDFFSVAAVAKYHAEGVLPTTCVAAPRPLAEAGSGDITRRVKVVAPSLLLLIAWWPLVSWLSPVSLTALVSRDVDGVAGYAFGSLLAGSVFLGSSGDAGAALVVPVAVLCLEVELDTVREVVLLCRSLGLTLLAIGVACSRPRAPWKGVAWGGVGGTGGWLLAELLLKPGLLQQHQQLVLTLMMGMYLGTALAYGLLEKVPCGPSRGFEGCKSAGIMVVAGLLGGVMTSTTGFGIDLVVFMAMKVHFKTDHKLAECSSDGSDCERLRHAGRGWLQSLDQGWRKRLRCGFGDFGNADGYLGHANGLPAWGVLVWGVVPAWDFGSRGIDRFWPHDLQASALGCPTSCGRMGNFGCSVGGCHCIGHDD